MTKNRLFLIAALLLAIILMVGVLAMMQSRSGVTKANFDRIHEGMTKTEVELILGETGLVFHGFSSHEPLTDFAWVGNDSMIFVQVTNNSVISKKWMSSTESIIDKIRRWLHLP